MRLLGADADGDGIDDATVNLADTDGDGLEDYRDPDSDNDGVIDGKKDGDFNGDGINDRLQRDPGVKTGLKGGGGSLGWLSLFMMLVLGCARSMQLAGRRTYAAFLAGLLCVLHVPSASAQTSEVCRTGSELTGGCWSVGLGFYTSTLKPDASQSAWRVTDDSDRGYKLAVEYRFLKRWFLELGYPDMGSALVDNRNPSIEGSEAIDYKAPSLFAGGLLFDPARRVNVHVKAGYAMLQTPLCQASVVSLK